MQIYVKGQLLMDLRSGIVDRIGSKLQFINPSGIRYFECGTEELADKLLNSMMFCSHEENTYELRWEDEYKCYVLTRHYRQ